EAAEKAEQKRLADKAKADAERDEFTLTGSDSPRDVSAAAGQNDLFDAPATKDTRTNPDAASERERNLRNLARDTEQPGDVMLGNGKFVTFTQAKAAAQAAIDDGSLMADAPFQYSNVLDIAPRDWDRMVKAMTNKEGAAKEEAETPADKPDALKEKEKAAKAKMLAAAGKLAQLLSKNTRSNITPEQEQQLLPIMVELFEGAMDLGYIKFKQAARYVREFLANTIDQETADSIPVDTLQGAYIAVARRHADKGVTPKGEVVTMDDLAEIDAAEYGDAEAKVEPAKAEQEAPVAEEPASDIPGAGIASQAPDRQLVEHTTVKGKTLRGVIRFDMTKEQAKEIDPYTFAKDGGYFIREAHIERLPPVGEPVNKDAAQSYVAPKAEETPEQAAEREAVARKARADKLRAGGQKLIDDAQEEQSRERQTNTARRVRMAGGAHAAAARLEAIGKSMLNLADAIESGEAQHLSGVSTKAAVEMLDDITAAAISRTDGKISYAKQQEQKGRAFN
ncbi:MAG: hypothetical protein ACOVN9_14635, partial [Inhella sp.]